MESSSSTQTAWSGWATLPMDILIMISDRLMALIDHVRLRAVCRNWAAVGPPLTSRLTPWLLLHHGVDHRYCTFLSLFENRLYRFRLGKRICGSSHGWLGVADFKAGGRVSLYNPLTDMTIPLPSAVNVIFRDDHTKKYQIDDYFIDRVILSADPDRSSQSCWVAIYYGGYCRRPSRLAFCKLGSKSWTDITHFLPEDHPIYSSFAFHNGKLYAVDIKPRIAIIELENPREVLIVQLETLPGRHQIRDIIMHFAKAEESLYLIFNFGTLRVPSTMDAAPTMHQRYRDGVLCYNICDFDETRKRLTSVRHETLEDRAMFVSLNCSIPCLASEVPACPRNCIYYIKDSGERDAICGRLRYEVCRYNLQSDVTERLVSVIVPNGKLGHPSGTWFMPSCSDWMCRKSSENSDIWIPRANGCVSVDSGQSWIDLSGEH